MIIKLRKYLKLLLEGVKGYVDLQVSKKNRRWNKNMREWRLSKLF